MDFAHTETDKAIEELEKRLQAEYRQAYKETKGKLEKHLAAFAEKDEAKRRLVDEGKLTPEKYKEWRIGQMFTGKRWQAMVDTLARDMNRTNQIAADIISGQLSPTFALNANYAAYGIENGFQTDFGFTLYNEDTVNRLIEENPDLLPAPRVNIPEDIRWNKQKITSNITQAVLQGKSIPEIAKTMQTVVGMNKASATRNARTAMTGAQNAGRQATYDRAKVMGIKVKKEWIATLDGRTRHSHGKADGQQVELDGKFTVGRAKMRYPGDVQNGTPKEIYNCRCTMATVEPPEIMRGEEPRMTYQEWVQTKEGQAELEKARIDRNKKAAKRRKAKKKQQNNAQNGLKSGGNGGIIKSEPQSELGVFKQKLRSDKRVSKEYYNAVKNKFSKGTDTAKKVFNKYIPKNSVENAYFEGIPHYSPSNKSISMNFISDLTNSRGAGATWFHEHGHMIDAVCGTVSNNSDFAKLLYDDYLAYMKAYGKRNGLKTFDKIQAAISKDLSSMREHSAVSDLLNGISKGNISGIAYHRPDYWENDAALCSEAFAHMFEAQFDKKRYKQMQKYFPNALNKFEEMLGGLE